MAQRVYSLRIFVAQSLTASSVQHVPDGVLYVIRDIDVFCRSGGAGDALYVLGSNAQVLWIATFARLGVSNTGQWRGRQVLYPGEPLTFTPDPGTWDVTASGYQLSLP